MDESLEKTLQGDTWNGHPIHPALVALPIGMWCLSAMLDFISLFTKNECVQEAADDALVAGLVGAGLAAVTGLGEYQRVPDDERAGQIALRHAVTNVSVVALNSVNAIIRNGRRGAGRPGGMFPKLLSWTTMSLISYSGWLGGKLVYNYGAAVDHSRAKKEEAREAEKRREIRAKRREEARMHASV